ncbi:MULTISPECIES: hypothetical protein [unclassified Hahella]|uniref:hypothetical protein n=1 Tax=unclassified Hahella TaxID=2624107 RepID=UPI001C1EAA65|nr:MULTISPECIES: hypothetical protein [unclassified Hahella]MBU6949914.1 hypothetical protein [Hahella sp. HN01]MDG9668292.1 hypothetical protein [Hahella sp. CR1]WLQ14667.1 hypothetical protein O5O45_01785 [Hahella sp. HNIBRBA332]
MKWVVLLAIVVAVVIWVVNSRKRNPVSDPEVKELDQKRYYVTPPKPGDLEPEDKSGTQY